VKLNGILARRHYRLTNRHKLVPEMFSALPGPRPVVQPLGWSIALAVLAWALAMAVFAAIAKTMMLAPLPAQAPLSSHIASGLFSYPDNLFSFVSLSLALAMATLYLGTRSGTTLRRARLWRALRLVFTPGYVRHRSHGLDILYYIANGKVFGLVLGWFIISGMALSAWTYSAVTHLFGPLTPTTLSPLTITVIGSLALYLAYELGYYIDHAISHSVPFFWEFHRVHHDAEVLSPLTTWRMHPVDSIKFANLLALTVGSTNGIMHFMFGLQYGVGTFSYSLVLTVFAYLLLQLHHTQIWIPFTGLLGRLLISPAHHQIHHSTNPIHFNRNLGSCLAIFDWAFGTLHIPAKQRERLTFGVTPVPGEIPGDAHSIVHSLLVPFQRSVRRLVAVSVRLRVRLRNRHRAPA
jgi:sterol desaturase/sphingolipid hydroxylase (fatty acid hydroxylase superfamily)